jgi:hypothetical protein
MPLEKTIKTAIYSALLSLFSCHTAIASTIINNYGSASSQPPAQAMQAPPPPPSQCNSNSVSTDPRVPPAGTYNIQHGDGSSEEVYTTGEKKPYYVDNNCGQNANTIAPQVYVQPNVINPTGPAATR